MGWVLLGASRTETATAARQSHRGPELAAVGGSFRPEIEGHFSKQRRCDGPVAALAAVGRHMEVMQCPLQRTGVASSVERPLGCPSGLALAER
jgi:hypothetical protein